MSPGDGGGMTEKGFEEPDLIFCMHACMHEKQWGEDEVSLFRELFSRSML